MYHDMSDKDLLDLFHDKFYPNDDRQQFYKDYGLQTEAPQQSYGHQLMNAIRVANDTVSHGLLNKGLDWAHQKTGSDIFGSGDEAGLATKAWDELPTTAAYGTAIGSGVAAFPAKIESTGDAALWGFGSGALDAYGHQKNWVPQNMQDVEDIGWGGLKGAGAMVGGQKIGEGIANVAGRGWNKIREALPTDDKLVEWVNYLKKINHPDAPVAEAKLNRVNNLRDIQKTSNEERLWGAPSTDPQSFGNYMEHNAPSMPGPEKQFARSMLERVQQEPSNLSSKMGGAGAASGGTAAGLFAKYAGAKSGVNSPLLTTIASGLGTAAGWVGGKGLGTVADNMLNRGKGRLPEQSLEDLISMARDPHGIGRPANPAVVNATRDLLSKAFLGGGKRYD
jgi:hypothetical protein